LGPATLGPHQACVVATGPVVAVAGSLERAQRPGEIDLHPAPMLARHAEIEARGALREPTARFRHAVETLPVDGLGVGQPLRRDPARLRAPVDACRRRLRELVRQAADHVRRAGALAAGDEAPAAAVVTAPRGELEAAVA